MPLKILISSLALAAGRKACLFCRENFTAGLELYGGLGTTDSFGWKQTSQYLAPVVQYRDAMAHAHDLAHFG